MKVSRVVGSGLIATASALVLGCPDVEVELGSGGSRSSTSTSGTAGAGGSGACAGHIYYAGMYPPDGGVLALSVWSSLPANAGFTGLAAGASQCQALGVGADHVCDLTEIQAAAAAHEPLLASVPQGTTAWMQRTTPVYVEGLSGAPCTAAMAGQTDSDPQDVCATPDGGVPCTCTYSPPGPGGNCNGWTYQGHISGDGEYYTFDQKGVPAYHFDNDTVFNPSQPYVHVHVGLDFACGGQQRAILCCFPSCK